MQGIPITDSIRDLAKVRIDTLKVLPGSHRKEAANEVGVLGELLVERAFDEAGIRYTADFRTTHDLTVPAGTVDIKTKDRTVVPRPEYDCSVPLYNHDHQRPDFYIFVSLLREKGVEGLERFTRGFIVGAIGQRALNECGVKWEAGQTDPSNGTTFWTDCLNVRVDWLFPWEKVVDLWSPRSAL